MSFPDIANNPLKLTADSWDHVRSRRILLPGITTPEEYNIRLSRGWREAVMFLDSLSLQDIGTAQTLAEIHGRLFEEIYPFAGQFRKIGEPVVAGTAFPADPKTILLELNLRELQFPQMLDSTIDGCLATAVFLHIRGKSIQPFLDGNKRSTRLEALSLVSKVLEIVPEWPPKELYYNAMQSAKLGNLTKMVNLLRESMGIDLSPSMLIRSPYRMRALQLTQQQIDADIPLHYLLKVSENTREKLPK